MAAGLPITSLSSQTVLLCLDSERFVGLCSALSSPLGGATTEC